VTQATRDTAVPALGWLAVDDADDATGFTAGTLNCPTIVGSSAAGPVVTGVHQVAYVEWGPPDAERVVVCVHGLARNARDFDVLARHLAGAGYRVVCPDMPGRGRSDWLGLPTPDGGYSYGQYVVDALALVARLGVPAVDWVGTSMGGLLGMMLAALPGSPVRRLVLNDVGPVVSGAFLDHLATYIGADPDFADLDGVEAYLRRTYAGFGDLPDAWWRHLAQHSARRKPDGAWGLAYDPAIGRALVAPMPDLDLRPLWSAVRCPVLLLRGESSPALPAEVAQEMTRTGPAATLVTVPGCGHAPSLTTEPQLETITSWLNQGLPAVIMPPPSSGP